MEGKVAGPEEASSTGINWAEGCAWGLNIRGEGLLLRDFKLYLYKACMVLAREPA